MRLRAVFLVGVALVLAPTVVAGAVPVVGPPTPISFGAGVELDPPNAYSPAIDCVADGECVAVGDFQNVDGGYEPMTMTMTGGTWGQAMPVPFPNGAQSDPENSNLWDVSCSALGECVAVGSYRLASSINRAGFTLHMTGGVWGPVTTVQFAGGVESPTPDTFVDRISCAAVGECVAGGRFRTVAMEYEAFTLQMTGGVWGQATAIAISPPRSTPRNESVRAISCPAVGECVAVGAFTRANGLQEIFTTSLTGGAWSSGATLPFASGQQASVPSSAANVISCPQVGSCVTGGSYVTSAGDYVAFTATMVGGVWGTPVEVPFAPGLQRVPGAPSCRRRRGALRPGPAVLDVGGAHRRDRLRRHRHLRGRRVLRRRRRVLHGVRRAQGGRGVGAGRTARHVGARAEPFTGERARRPGMCRARCLRRGRVLQRRVAV